jgi:tRNA A37 threonylcarbamoyladenosine biosynthesis protein TsaE
VRGPVTSPTFVLARTHPSIVGGPALVHVDAYRLASAVELDDLDIDFARSVVVVEWGTGMLDGVSESWLELRIDRPVGAASVGVDAEDKSSAAQVGVETGVAGFDPAEELVEPRTVTVCAVGPRWAGAGSLDALR